jgi:hypothetical protein
MVWPKGLKPLDHIGKQNKGFVKPLLRSQGLNFDPSLCF